MKHEVFCTQYGEMLRQIKKIQPKTQLSESVLQEFESCSPCDEGKKEIWKANREKIGGLMHIIAHYLEYADKYTEYSNEGVNAPLSIAISRLYTLFCSPEAPSKEAA